MTRHTLRGALEAVAWIAAFVAMGLGSYGALILSGASDPSSSLRVASVQETGAPDTSLEPCDEDPAEDEHVFRCVRVRGSVLVLSNEMDGGTR